MRAEDIVLLGIKHNVIALQRKTGARIWSTKVASGMSANFVTLIADETRVFVHAGGELYCLDLFTDEQLWHDKLAGLGYGLATLGLPGRADSSAFQTTHAMLQQQQDSANAAANSAAAAHHG